MKLKAVLFTFLLAVKVFAQCPVVSGFQICNITADTSGTHNIIVWDKTGFAQVDTFLIQRLSTPGNYVTVGRVPYDSLSLFHDYGANPSLDTFQYKMGVIDTCGNRFDTLTPYHRPAFFSQSSVGVFVWTYYYIENYSVPTYASTNYLLRDSLSNGQWDTVAQTSFTQQILTDINCYYNPGNYPNARWQLATLWTYPSVPTMKATTNNGHYVLTGVNKTHFAGIKKDEPGKERWWLYPNPAQRSIIIEGLPFSNATEIQIFNLLGTEVLRTFGASPKVSVDVSALPAGCYFLQIGKTQTKFIKE